MSKSRDIADSAATINFIDGLTSDAQSQIDTATSDIATKAPLSNPTFTGTVLASTGLQVGSGAAVRAIETFGSVPSWRLNDTDVSGLYHEFVGTAAGTASLRIDHGNVDSNSDFDISVDGAKVAIFDSTGIDVTGTVTATAFSGDGSGLTGVDPLPSQTGNANKFLTTDGTNASWDAVDISSEITGTLPVANGGIGATTLAANNVLLGNGTSTPLAVAPSTSGNVLTSNGSTWQSVAPAGGGAWTFISETEITSSVSAVDITSGIDSTYKNYQIIFDGIKTSATSQLRIELYKNGVLQTSNYYYDDLRGTTLSQRNAQTTIYVGEAMTSFEMGGFIWLFNVASGIGRYHIISSDVGGFSNASGRHFNNTDAVTGLRIKSLSGTMTAGTFKLYGLS